MSVRCFVHIGAPKTGSTFLQKTLFDNRARLRERGVLYPEVSLRGYGHHDLAFLLSGGYPEWATPQPKSLDELTGELRNAAAGYDGTIVLSSEDFYLFPAPARLRDMLSAAGVTPAACRIVVYVRRQDEAHESWYNQTIKAQGSTNTVEQSVTKFHDLWDYDARLAAWAAVFGEENIAVRIYDDHQFEGGSLESDFFAALSIPMEGLTISRERVNAEINGDLLEFQRLFNALPLDVREKRRYHKRLIELTRHAAGTGRFSESRLLDTARRQEILAQYERGNRAVAAKYLGRERLFEHLEQSPEKAAAASGLTAEKLAYIAQWLFSDMETNE